MKKDDDGATFGYQDLVFDRSIMRSTLIEEYQLLCGRLVQSVKGAVKKTFLLLLIFIFCIMHVDLAAAIIR